MNSFSYKYKQQSLLVCLSILSCSAWTEEKGAWTLDTEKKENKSLGEEKEIQRSRVKIHQKLLETRSLPKRLEEMEWGKAQQFRLDQKTEELISELEALAKRTGQSSRQGEVKMRLAEMYFERSQSVGNQESTLWENELKNWESSTPEEKKKASRPLLKTPKADHYRQLALKLYRDLERKSRKPKQAQSLMIRRDDVLYFLGSTLHSLGQIKESIVTLEELLKKFRHSQRVFSAQLQLADLYFIQNHFDRAIPHYLQIAGAATNSSIPNLEALKTYALYKLGWCYLNSHQAPKAILAFQKTIERSRATQEEHRLAFEKEALGDLIRAFVQAKAYKEGEKYFKDASSDARELLPEYMKEAAIGTRDQGEYELSIYYFDKAIELAQDSERLELKFNRVEVFKKKGVLKEYVSELRNLGKDLTASSNDEYRGEYVDLLRREAKFYHRSAQNRHRDSQHLALAENFYKIYFEWVPEQFKDDKEHVGEMNFFQGELLFDLGEFKEAAQSYSKVDAGHFALDAAYARVVSLQNAVEKDRSIFDEFKNAGDRFAEKYPNNPKTPQILYHQAYEAYRLKDADTSLQLLKGIVAKYSSQNMGVEAAQRIMYLLEQKKDLNALDAEVDSQLKNSVLLSKGGAKFKNSLLEIKERAQFKVVESLSEENTQAKAEAYKVLLKESSNIFVREKALNNLAVYSFKGGDLQGAHQARIQYLKEFSKGKAVRDFLLLEAEEAVKNTQWNEALHLYEEHHEKFPDDSLAKEVLWNLVGLRSHLEETYRPEEEPSRDISKKLEENILEYLKKYPKDEKSPLALELISYRKTSSPSYLEHLQKSLGVKISQMHKILEDAHVVVVGRSNNIKLKKELLNRYDSGSVKVDLPFVVRKSLARSAFQLLENSYQQYLKTALNYKTAALFVQTLKKKTSSLESLEKGYLKVVAYRNGEWALKSLDRTSRAFLQLANDIKKYKTSNEDEAKVLQTTFVEPLKTKAESLLNLCLAKALEIKEAGLSRQACLQSIRELSSSDIYFADPKMPANLSLKINEVADSVFVKRALDDFQKQKWGSMELSLEQLQKPSVENKNIEASVHLLRGLHLWHDGMGELAVNEIRQASQLESISRGLKEESFLRLAQIYFEVGDYSSAVESLEGLGKDVRVLWIRALAQMGLKKSRDAVDTYNEALEVDPKNSDLLFNLALAQAASGDKKQAIQSLKKYVELRLPPATDRSRSLMREWKEDSK